MSQETNGLRFLAGMLLDQDELRWSQDERNERLGWLLLGMAHEVGWMGDHVGPVINFGWEAYDGGSGALAVRNTTAGGVLLGIDRLRASTERPYLGIDNNGRVLEVITGGIRDDAFATITVPDDGVWRTLIARYAVHQREPGRIVLTGGSVSVVGTGTQFTRYGDSTDDKASIIRIDATDTSEDNDGEYEIDTITDDENMTLVVAPPTTESSVRFRLKGRFFAGDPADPDTRANATVQWELVTRTTTRPADGALVAYDVMRTGGVLTTIDRRRANIYQPRQNRPLCYALMPTWLDYSFVDDTMTNRAFSVQYENNIASANTKFYGISAAPCATGSHLTGLATDQATGLMTASLWDNNTTRTIRVWHHTVGAEPDNAWDDPDGGSAVDVVAATGIADVALIALPENSGNTHACFYVDTNGSVIQKTSTDNGATWSSATTIWNPAGAEVVSRIAAVLTRMNRIVLVAAYSTGARVRWIYSDDLAASWNNNSQAGFGFTGASTAAVDLAVCEDDRGNLWTVVVVDTTNRLQLWRGQSEGDPSPDSDEQSDGWPIGPDGALTDDASYVDVVAMPNGTLSIVCDVENGGAREIHYLSVARRNILHRQRIVDNANETGAYPVAVCLGVSASGHLWLGWGSTDDTAGVYDLRLHLAPYAPVAVERSLAWYGGQ